MIRFVLILCFLFLTKPLVAQLNEIDSLELINFKKKLKGISTIGKRNVDSAIFLLNRLHPEFKKYKDSEIGNQYLLSKAYVYLNKKESDSIISIVTPIIKNLHSNISQKANAHLYIGHAYKIKWIPDSTLVHYIKSLKLFSQTHDQRGLSLTYLALGLAYSKLENKETATYFYDKSMKYSINSKVVSKHKEFFKNQDDMLASTHNYLELSLDILKIAETQEDDVLMIKSYYDIKKHYFKLGNYGQALAFAQKELQASKKAKKTSFLPSTHAFIGNIYSLQNKPNLAIRKFKEALPGSIDSLRLELYKNLKDQYVNTDNLGLALGMMDQYVALKDSMQKRNTEASVARIMEQYQTELQAKKIDNLETKNELNAVKIATQRTTVFGTIGGSVLLLVVILFGYKNYKSKQELRHSQLNFKLLQTQMNPHFMFNALNGINNHLNSNDTGDVSRHINSYSTLMRSILEGSTKEFVTIKEDVQLIENYLLLQQLVHENNFNFNINISENINVHFMEIPPMLVQPFVENAVLHGLKDQHNGLVEVNYVLEDEVVCVSVKDNGNGIPKKNKYSGNELHQSLGTKIIDQRLETYRKLHQFIIDKTVKSKENEGTHIMLRFPIKLKIM